MTVLTEMNRLTVTEPTPTRPHCQRLDGQADSASRSRWLITVETPSPRMDTP
jgi:hypothetical protein